jgi:UPF0288 family protein (methanogenesis marker protein 3)
MRKDYTLVLETRDASSAHTVEEQKRVREDSGCCEEWLDIFQLSTQIFATDRTIRWRMKDERISCRTIVLADETQEVQVTEDLKATLYDQTLVFRHFPIPKSCNSTAKITLRIV